jgi:hypothetical protein
MLVSLVGDALAQCSGLELSRAITWAEASRGLEDDPPDVLLFDLTDQCESRILPLLFRKPALLMIGLDAECNQALLVSGQEARGLTMDQIRHIIEHD